jgi:hypothetical protein
LSSILDALKKAEQVSAEARRKPTPWPAPPSAATSERRHMRRWFMGIGVTVIAALVIWLIWTNRQPATAPSAASAKTASPPAAQKMKPTQALAQKARPLPFRSRPPVKLSQNAARPLVIAHQRPPAATLQPERTSKASSLAQTTIHKQIAIAKTNSSDVSVPTADRQNGQTAYPVRNDPRIKLQALVWSSEAVDRFVIINNRLIKEGGSVNNIVVVQINRDNVLVSEGPDRWLEPFNVH